MQIVLEDNDWSIAVELLYNELHIKKITDAEKLVFQTIHMDMRNYLISQLGTIYTRNGSWSIEPLTRKIAKAQDAVTPS